MKLRLSTAQDVPEIMTIIEKARAFLKASGVDQWQTGYPDEALIREDIATGIGYVLVDGDIIAATLSIDCAGEPAYDAIEEGAWLSTNLPYGVVHRMAVSPAYRGKGISKVVMAQVEALLLEQSMQSFKIDTHQDNPVMNHMLTRCGFSYCGIIYFEGAARLAYEKLLVKG